MSNIEGPRPLGVNGSNVLLNQVSALLVSLDNANASEIVMVVSLYYAHVLSLVT